MVKIMKKLIVLAVLCLTCVLSAAEAQSKRGRVEGKVVIITGASKGIDIVGLPALYVYKSDIFCI